MDIMSQTLKEIAEEDSQQVETPVETVEAKPEEVPADVVDDKKVEDSPEQDKPEEKPVEESDKPVEEEPKPKAPKDTSQFTKEEKAEFAFRRQLAKKDEKHRQEIEELVKSFDKKFDDFKASMTKKEPEPVKTRADFPLDKGGDDAYIKYLVKQGMDEERAAQQAEQDKADKEREQQEAEQAEYAERQRLYAENFQTNCATAIPEDEREDFQAKVKLAKDNGLGGLLDQAPVLRDFIFSTKRGPKLLHAMLKERDIFANVMQTAAMSVNPMSTYIELDDIARNYEYKKPEPEPEPRTMPHLGKPGGGGKAVGDVKDITNDDAELIKFMRARR